MTTKALLLAIIDAPEDDTPRLVYADWLEEHGEPDRAEFIRVQCKLARLPPSETEGEALESLAPDVINALEFLQKRERELWQEHDRLWAWPVSQWVNAWKFRRGFVESVTVRPERFLEHEGALFQAAPIRSVTFQTAMFQLSRPHVVCPSAGPLMQRLAECPSLARLSALSFWACYLGDNGVTTLALSTFLAQLHRLNLQDNDLGDTAVQALAASPNFAQLTSLDLSSNRISAAGTRALTASRYITGLASLNLAHNAIGDEGVQALAESPRFAQLTMLNLARTGLGTAAALALAESPHLPQLRSLDVRDNRIGNKARQVLKRRFGKGRCRF
jgi:uncharacterized protein (TIGR02996 family)